MYSRVGFSLTNGQDYCEKFALLEERLAFDPLSLLYFIPDLTMSETIVLPGFSTFKSPFKYLQEKFFTVYFLRDVALLEACGIFTALKNHVSRWHTCLRVNKRKRFLGADALGLSHMSHVSGAMRRCVSQVHGYVRKPRALQEASAPEVTSYSQLFTTFVLYLISIALF